MKRITIIIIIAAFAHSVNSQTNAIVLRNEFKVDGKDGFRQAWGAIKQGDKLYNMGKGSYYLARENYKVAYEYNNMNPELNYKLGVSMLMSDEKYKANSFLTMAYDAKPDVTPDIHLMLGRSYHMVHEFDKAIEHYIVYKNSLKKRMLKKYGDDVDLLISQCENGKRLIEDPVRAVIETLGSSVNSKFDDYSAVVSANDSLMVFTSRRDHSKRSKISEQDYKYYESVYYSVKMGDNWGSAVPLFSKKNVTENMASVGLTQDGKTLFVYKGAEGGGNIHYTTMKKGKWQKTKEVSGPINSRTKEGSVAITPDGSTMYFISERRGGAGGFDIYISRQKKNGKWDKPVNAGMVNTPYDEMGLAVHPNGKTLYFSSQGHNSMGGFDIFKSNIDESGNLTNVENMGYPINTADDDMFYVPVGMGRVAYMTSIRENTVGAKDIYRVNILGPEKDMLFGFDEIALSTPDLDIFSEEPEKMDIAAFSVTGMVTDAQTNAGLPASVQLIDEATNRSVARTNASASGQYSIQVEKPGKFIVKALSNGYMPYSDEVDLTVTNKAVLNIALDKIEVGKKVVLKNIYFDSGTSRLKKESTEELENAYAFLVSNPSLVVEIAGFTDNIGSIDANLRLSKARAKACVDYLVKKGIDRNRLKYEGYGFLNPISDNHTAEGRSKNRRVEFKILGQ